MANEIPSYIMKIGNHELNYSEKLMNVVLNLSEGKNTFMYCMTIGVVRKKSAKWEKIETKKYGFILHSPNSKKSNSVSYGRTYLLPSILISVRLDEKQFKFLISSSSLIFFSTILFCFKSFRLSRNKAGKSALIIVPVLLTV